MKIQESAENYLETILVLSRRLGNVRSIDVANELNFSKPSISYAMKQFRENGYVTMDENGYLRSDYAQPDGLHLSGTGYSAWVDYLCTHVPYDKDNPYQVGSTCYLSDEWKELISDLS